MFSRGMATDDVLRNNRALIDYLHKVQVTLASLSLEMAAVERASRRRLPISRGRKGIDEKQKLEATKAICSSLRWTARFLNVASKSMGKAYGFAAAAFEFQESRGRNRGRGQGGQGRGQGQGNQSAA
jgi:hypothetical protein